LREAIFPNICSTVLFIYSMYKIITETSIFAPLCLLFGNR
jgi:hypothetical protein